jgi:hypothetical protein
MGLRLRQGERGNIAGDEEATNGLSAKDGAPAHLLYPCPVQSPTGIPMLPQRHLAPMTMIDPTVGDSKLKYVCDLRSWRSRFVPSWHGIIGRVQASTIGVPIVRT